MTLYLRLSLDSAGGAVLCAADGLRTEGFEILLQNDLLEAAETGDCRCLCAVEFGKRQHRRHADSAADEVGLFDEVDVYIPKYDQTRTVRIVTTLRNDVFTNNISKESPFGKALLGAKAEQTVTVTVNEKNSYDVKVVAIRKGKDDASLPIGSF